MKHRIRRERKEHDQFIYLVAREGLSAREQAIKRIRSNTTYPFKASQFETSSRIKKNISSWSISFLIAFILKINYDVDTYDRFLMSLYWQFVQRRGRTYLRNLHDSSQKAMSSADHHPADCCVYHYWRRKPFRGSVKVASNKDFFFRGRTYLCYWRVYYFSFCSSLGKHVTIVTFFKYDQKSQVNLKWQLWCDVSR